MANDYEFRDMQEGEQAIEIDPATVKCGLCMVPFSLRHWIQKQPPIGFHDLLRQNFRSFWDEVLQIQPQLMIHHMVSSDECAGQACASLPVYAPLKGLNVALLILNAKCDDGSTSDVIYGFAWEDRHFEKLQVVFANKDGVVPAKVRKDVKEGKAWWKFWKS